MSDKPKAAEIANPISGLTREQATAVVAPHVIMVKQYQAVPKTVAFQILGDERYLRLMADKIRNLGPNEETVYPWNVVDYVHVPDLGIHE